MSITIGWQTSVAASALHAAERLIRGAPVVDQRLDSALAGPAELLGAEFTAGHVVAADVWSQLLPLSATASSVRERVSVALTKALGRERATLLAPALAGPVGAIEQALARTMPELSDELELRLPPWRQQWEARGPGLLFGIRRLAEAELLPDSATVVLVHPAAGGAGRAFAPCNQVLFEALLTDADPRLPELVRLGWLFAQLNLDLPRYADLLPRDRLHRAATLGLVPLVLAAAEETELARADGNSLRLAIAAWELADQGPPELPEILETWYGVYCDSRPTFGTSLLALDEMLLQH